MLSTHNKQSNKRLNLTHRLKELTLEVTFASQKRWQGHHPCLLYKQVTPCDLKVSCRVRTENRGFSIGNYHPYTPTKAVDNINHEQIQVQTA